MLTKTSKPSSSNKFKQIVSSFKPKNTLQKKSLNSENLTPSLAYDQRASLVDTINANIGALAQAAICPIDDINRLIKKMTLSFSAKKNESSFYIKDGLFSGAYFILLSKEQDLSLIVSQVHSHAKALLRQKECLLATKLKKYEINLRSIQFL